MEENIEAQREAQVNAGVIQDLGIQLANLTIQKAYAEAQVKSVANENIELKTELQRLQDELAELKPKKSTPSK